MQSSLQSDGGEHSTCRARAQGTFAINVGHIGQRSASKHDDHIDIEIIDIRRRFVNTFERAHHLLGDEARAQQIKHQRERRNDGGKFGIVLNAQAVSGDGKERDDEYPGRQYPTRAEFQQVDQWHPSFLKTRRDFDKMIETNQRRDYDGID